MPNCKLKRKKKQEVNYRVSTHILITTMSRKKKYIEKCPEGNTPRDNSDIL